MRLPAALLTILAAAVAVALAYGSQTRSGEDRPSATTATPARGFEREAPNLVVVMTDDQALDTMRAMPRTRRLIGGQGVTFENAVVSYPLCCPSRATFLTGQYAHNHGVRSNQPPAGGYPALDGEQTLPVWLSRAGYRTGFVGKYLNGYGKGDRRTEVPPGWSEWYGVPAETKHRAYDFYLNENGRIVRYGPQRRRHKTDLFADRAVEFVRERAPERRPVFLWVATTAPHLDLELPDDTDRNPEPPPADRGRFEGAKGPRGPSVDEADISDKPDAVRRQPRLRRAQRREIDKTYVSQLESLAGVDRLVARTVAALRRTGELDRTVFVFTSDQGWMRGQHRIAYGKSQPYEEAIRVPLLVRGPGFPRGVRDRRLVSNLELAPTLLDAAGAEADHPLDGSSLLPFRRAGRRDLLIEILKNKGTSVLGLRTQRYSYASYEDGARELYDLRRDPHQLTNLARRPSHSGVVERLSARVAELRECEGGGCRGR